MTESSKTETKEIQFSLDLNGYYWAINERSDMGVPAVELDISTGKYLVLLFTSKESAQKFCYVRNPDAAANIYQLPRRIRKDETTGKQEVIQTGLIKIACRILTAKMGEISHFVIDHPGTRGPATYLSVEDMAYAGRKPLPKDIKSVKELSSFLENVED